MWIILICFEQLQTVMRGPKRQWLGQFMWCVLFSLTLSALWQTCLYMYIYVKWVSSLSSVLIMYRINSKTNQSTIHSQVVVIHVYIWTWYLFMMVVVCSSSDCCVLQGHDSVVGCIVPNSAVESWYNEGTDSDALSPVRWHLYSIIILVFINIICSILLQYGQRSHLIV